MKQNNTYTYAEAKDSGGVGVGKRTVVAHLLHTVHKNQPTKSKQLMHGWSYIHNTQIEPLHFLAVYIW